MSAATARALRRDPLGFLVRETSGSGIARLAVGSRTVLAVATPAGAREALVARRDELVKEQTIATRTPCPVPAKPGLLTSNVPERHLAARRTLQPVFASQRFEELRPTIEQEAERLVDGWARTRSGIDVEQTLTETSVRVAIRTLFDREPADAGAFAADVRDVLASFRLVLGRTAPVVALLRFREGLRFVRAVGRADDSLREVDRDGPLARALDEAGADGDLRVAEARAIVFAAVETTSVALTWALAELARRPALLDELADGDAEAAARVFSETLRLYPPAWYVGRVALEGTEVAGEHVPEGDMVLVVTYAIHRSAAYWDEPARFDPDRWRGGGATARASFAFLPFGGGVRQCIGERLAWLEAEAVLLAVARRFRLELRSAVPRPLPAASLRPASPVLMNVHPREAHR